MVMSKSYKAGEGTLTVQFKDDGIQLKYGSIDDYCKKEFSIDELMGLLGYKK